LLKEKEKAVMPHYTSIILYVYERLAYIYFTFHHEANELREF